MLPNNWNEKKMHDSPAGIDKEEPKDMVIASREGELNTKDFHAEMLYNLQAIEKSVNEFIGALSKNDVRDERKEFANVIEDDAVELQAGGYFNNQENHPLLQHTKFTLQALKSVLSQVESALTGHDKVTSSNAHFNEEDEDFVIEAVQEVEESKTAVMVSHTNPTNATLAYGEAANNDDLHGNGSKMDDQQTIAK